jgi:hypothetical protein
MADGGAGTRLAVLYWTSRMIVSHAGTPTDSWNVRAGCCAQAAGRSMPSLRRRLDHADGQQHRLLLGLLELPASSRPLRQLRAAVAPR